MPTDREFPSGDSRPVAIFLPSLAGGGAEKTMLALANGLVDRGFAVDLVLGRATGPYLGSVRPQVSVLDLGASRMVAALPGLVRYLRRRRPVALFSGLDHANIVALLSQQVAGVDTRTIVSHRNNPRWTLSRVSRGRRLILQALAYRYYRRADRHVAISHGIAKEAAAAFRIPETKIATIYNPVVSHELKRLSKERPDHPFFDEGRPPVIVAVGRLTAQKDFPTLIRAFAELRAKGLVNLVILGEGEQRDELRALAEALAIGDSVAMPGFAANPYAFMRSASLFVLSSVAEGLGNVLVEAMACGAPVVSTDCPYGPAEILENGRWGRLVPVGDVKALAEAMRLTLGETDRPDVVSRADAFGVDKAVDAYVALLNDVLHRSEA